MYIEPRRIEFNIAMISTAGGEAVGMETASPHFECEFHLRDGAHGSVSIPLDPDERAFLREIVIAVSERARRMAQGLANQATVAP